MKYKNPIISGFHPDPSICRVGKEYYLATSSFEYFPGIPIYHSMDLVNWTHIGNAVSWDNPLPVVGKNGEVKASGGIWAPTLRFHDGRFYVTATLDGRGNFIVYTDDPGGAWSKPVWVPVGGIDPSLFFEDGKAYYCTNDNLGSGEEGIALGMIDVQSGEVLQDFQVIWRGTGGKCLEAPHLYHIGDWYYIVTAEGGTFFTHRVTIGRSRKLWGPYESCPHNPILTNMTDMSWEAYGAGHADLLEDAQGNWWMVHLATRTARRTMSHLGRETFLTPFRWEAGWPVVADGGKAQLEEEGPLTAAQEERCKWTDDFTENEWNCRWRFVGNPDMTQYERTGSGLRMTPRHARDIASCMLCVPQPDFVFDASVELDAHPVQDGDEAGFALYHTKEFHYLYGIREKDGEQMLFLEKRAEDFRQCVFEKALCGESVAALRVRGEKEQYFFDMRYNDSEWVCMGTASTRFLSCEVVGRSFTGTMLGLYALISEPGMAAERFSVVFRHFELK